MKKRYFLKMLLISILSVFSVHLKASCGSIGSFQENYTDSIQQDDVFFIKGVALDIFEYGRTIKVIEDLKGNLADKSSIFVWGEGCPSDGYFCITMERLDYMSLYNENDTLIMLVRTPYVYEGGIETSDDYATFSCGYSVLKLSNGFVSGRIFSSPEEWQYPEETTILWEELCKLLLNSASTSPQSVKIKNTIYQENGTVFFENMRSEVIKLSFYDLAGKLVYETATTSNNYRPALSRGIYVCKINMNEEEQQTIKYIAP